MRLRYFMYITVIAVMLAAVVKGEEQIEPPKVEFFKADKLEMKDWQNFENTHATTVIIEFQAGDYLPLDLKFGGNTVDSQFSEIGLNVKRRFFLKFSQGLVYYSKDANNWVPSKDAFTLKLRAGVVDDRLNLSVESNVKN